MIRINFLSQRRGCNCGHHSPTAPLFAAAVILLTFVFVPGLVWWILPVGAVALALTALVYRVLAAASWLSARL